MDHSITSFNTIRAKARRAYKNGVPRNAHGIDSHYTDAIDAWQDEWDRCAVAESVVLKVKPMLARVGVTPP